MDIDLINVAIYVCASLGGVLLLLCIILASFFVYNLCVKYFGSGGIGRQQYVIVPTENTNGQNGQIVLRKFSTEDLEKNGILPTSISFENEAEVKNSFPMKNVPPVKKKMLWKQKKKSYQQQSIPFQNDPVIEEVEDIKFNEEELDVPKTERLFKSKFKEKRKSKSEWDLHDSSSESDSISLITNRGMDTQQSQYFDALDTIEENEEESDEDDLSDLDEAATLVTGADLWEDISGSDTDDTSSGVKASKLAVKPTSNKQKRQNSAVIQRRINALKVLQLQSKAIETKFYVELYELEASHNIKLKQPLYEKRRKVINDKDAHGGESGIEGFWLQAMDNCESLKHILQNHDRP